MRKNSHDKILRGKPKEQHLSTILKPCSKTNHNPTSLKGKILI